jgi:predicted ATPase with chaperone activity
MLAAVGSAALVGIDAYDVIVEVDAAQGLPQWRIVGLAASAVKQSRERVGAALVNSGFVVPRGYHRVLKVARTIADLEDVAEVAAAHIAEALRYRPLAPRKRRDLARHPASVHGSCEGILHPFQPLTFTT